ncbi:MAG: phenylalanine--tRNA ligase subunit beta [Eubacterium sp.]|nr:phenylalanine--tRNA ligase subunit beta [Eubacterium sp.]
MLLSVNWIKDYVDVDVPVHEFGDRMIMSGSNIETIEEIGTGISGVVIGKVVSMEKHPDADRLLVCGVDIGAEEPVQVVTSAGNVAVGAFVPVALDGSHVPALHGAPKKAEGFDIKAGEMRGVRSDGMLCGPQELGLDDKVAPYVSKDGIWILPGDWTESLGKPADEVLGLNDFVIDFEITPNRPDCLSMLGMAREAAATFGTTMRYPETDLEKADEDSAEYIDVEVKSDMCKRYTARVIKDVKIEQSPWWLQKRLIAAGMRPINNIVDITNFVMLEYGQPLHAFDIETLAGRKIVVDMVPEGTKFTTLDGEERTIAGDMLMINDAEKPVAIAGVMGGLDSDIKETTTTVVLESASFVGHSVRMTAKRLGMRTEASGRYEKGIDPNNCEAAADRFCKLVQILGCGKVLNGAVDVYKEPETAPTVTARVSRINKVLGTELTRDEMVKILESLEMNVEGEGDEMVVTPPTVRQDLLEEVDYVEEVARMYGYDNLPMRLPAIASKPEFSKSWTMRAKARDLLSGMGLNEVQTFSFSNQKVLDLTGVPKDSPERDLIRITNPMGDDTEFMRTMLLPNMLEVLKTNYAKNNENVRAYEIGITFHRGEEGSRLPVEKYGLAIGMYGEQEDFFSLKGIVTELMTMLGIGRLKFRAVTGNGTFHPGRCAEVFAGKNQDIKIGIMGEVHPDVLGNFEIDERAYAAEFDFNKIVEIEDHEIHYEKPPIYPASTRDIAVIVGEGLEVGELEDAIRDLSIDILEDVKLFDIYRGIPVPPGMKSVAFSMTYRRSDRTLTDAETDAAHQQIVEALRNKFGAVLRDQ